MSVDDVYAILNAELEDCFICGALLRRRYSIQHEAWHRRLEGDDVAPP
jgi:hypothetical protein